MASESIDENFDSNFEKVNSFDIHGNLVQSSYDTNENGVYEKCLVFNHFHQHIASFIDVNEDVFFD